MALQTEIANCNASVSPVVGVNTIQSADQTVAAGLSPCCTGVYNIGGTSALFLQGSSVLKIG